MRDMRAVRVLWTISPTVLAGLGHVLILKTSALERFAVPLDAGMHWRGRPLFGPNKTWRGFLVMTALCALLTRAQAGLGRPGRRAGPSLVDFDRTNAWLVGGALGLAYCLAELPNSFVKRRLGIPPGAYGRRLSWLQYAVDQVDSVAGCLIVLRVLARPSRRDLALAFGIGTGIHVAVDALLYLIGVKRRSA